MITSFSTERLPDIIDLFDSLKLQTYPKLEIIFVVDHSKQLFDSLVSYTSSQNMMNTRIILNENELGLSTSRNIGIENANGDVIAFLNDDVVVPSSWGEDMIRPYLAYKNVIGVTGPAFPLWSTQPVSWMSKEMTWLISCTSWFDFNFDTEVRSAWGMNMSFRKKAFVSSGFFSTKIGMCGGASTASWNKLSAEETEFSMRVRKITGMRIIYSPNPFVYHKTNLQKVQWSYIITKSLAMGGERAMLRRLFPREKDVFKTESLLLESTVEKLFASFLSFFRRPIKTFSQASAILVSLFFLGLGYYLYLMRTLPNSRAYISSLSKSSIKKN